MAQVDHEMRDILIALRQQVQDGFANINAKLDGMERKTEGHETRIRSLEDWRTEVKGGAKGIGLSWKIGSALIGALMGILGVIGFQLTVVPTDAPEPATYSATIWVRGQRLSG